MLRWKALFAHLQLNADTVVDDNASDWFFTFWRDTRRFTAFALVMKGRVSEERTRTSFASTSVHLKTGSMGRRASACWLLSFHGNQTLISAKVNDPADEVLPLSKPVNSSSLNLLLLCLFCLDNLVFYSWIEIRNYFISWRRQLQTSACGNKQRVNNNSVTANTATSILSQLLPCHIWGKRS